ncbi:MAG TPA: 2-oxo acid dehydrogenase subunit E2, partial [Microlunatus sp.]|nr:2-oxo acid dehydrogenase subunit E2 [Microlunatus sp.]
MPDPSSSTQTATDALAEEFGANDWLLEEMYEQYVSDPGSVDPTWAEYFKTHQLGGASNGSTGNGSSEPAAEPAAPTAAPKAAAAPKSAAAPAKQAAAPAPAPSAPAQPAATAPAGAAAKRPATVERPTSNKNARPSAPGNRGGVPADPPNPANRPTVDLEEPVRTVLRGAPARTAKNMDSSLTVPTATSVRSLPVKLLIDQRVVINNHLRRARGGKVSYTHLIGFAMVQALKTHPEMNKGYDVVDGKPTMIEPRHINLGLAIDLPKPDGTRQLLVPSIKSCEDLDFAQFWAAYEEVVKKARAGNLTVEDFAGTTITLTNPGTIGTNHSVPRLM